MQTAFVCFFAKPLDGNHRQRANIFGHVEGQVVSAFRLRANTQEQTVCEIRWLHIDRCRRGNFAGAGLFLGLDEVPELLLESILLAKVLLLDFLDVVLVVVFNQFLVENLFSKVLGVAFVFSYKSRAAGPSRCGCRGPQLCSCN